MKSTLAGLVRWASKSWGDRIYMAMRATLLARAFVEASCRAVLSPNLRSPRNQCTIERPGGIVLRAFDVSIKAALRVSIGR